MRMDKSMRQEDDFSDHYANYSINPIIEDEPLNSFGSEIDFRYRDNPEELMDIELMFSQPFTNIDGIYQ